MTRYKLGSSPLVGAPGIIAWAVNGYHFEKDRAQLLGVITGTWNTLPPETADKLLRQELTWWHDEDGTVIFDDEKPIVIQLKEKVGRHDAGTTHPVARLVPAAFGLSEGPLTWILRDGTRIVWPKAEEV